MFEAETWDHLKCAVTSAGPAVRGLREPLSRALIGQIESDASSASLDKIGPHFPLREKRETAFYREKLRNSERNQNDKEDRENRYVLRYESTSREPTGLRTAVRPDPGCRPTRCHR